MHGLDIQIVYQNNLTGLEFKYNAFVRPIIFDDNGSLAFIAGTKKVGSISNKYLQKLSSVSKSTEKIGLSRL